VRVEGKGTSCPGLHDCAGKPHHVGIAGRRATTEVILKTILRESSWEVDKEFGVHRSRALVDDLDGHESSTARNDLAAFEGQCGAIGGPEIGHFKGPGIAGGHNTGV